MSVPQKANGNSRWSWSLKLIGIWNVNSHSIYLIYYCLYS